MASGGEGKPVAGEHQGEAECKKVGTGGGGRWGRQENHVFTEVTIEGEKRKESKVSQLQHSPESD